MDKNLKSWLIKQNILKNLFLRLRKLERLIGLLYFRFYVSTTVFSHSSLSHIFVLQNQIADP